MGLALGVTLAGLIAFLLLTALVLWGAVIGLLIREIVLGPSQPGG